MSTIQPNEIQPLQPEVAALPAPSLGIFAQAVQVRMFLRMSSLCSDRYIIYAHLEHHF